MTTKTPPDQITPARLTALRRAARDPRGVIVPYLPRGAAQKSMLKGLFETGLVTETLQSGRGVPVITEAGRKLVMKMEPPR